jgi:hypothetical protein
MSQLGKENGSKKLDIRSKYERLLKKLESIVSSTPINLRNVVVWLDTLLHFVKETAENFDFSTLRQMFEVRNFRPELYPRIRNTLENKAKYLIQATLWILCESTDLPEDVETIRIINMQREVYLS